MCNTIFFESRKLNQLTYWVCVCDNGPVDSSGQRAFTVIAQAWSLVGVRSQVLSLLRNQKWSI